MEHYKIEFESIPWEEPAPGAHFKAFAHGGKKLRLVEFTSEFIEPDWCRKDHIGYVLQGELEINFSGRLMKFKAGDGIFIPGGEASKHIAKVIGDVARLIFVENA